MNSSYLRHWLGECLGTFVLVLFGCSAVAGAVTLNAFSSLLEVALIWGFAVALAIFLSRNLSDAHLNPAVTLAMILAGRLPVSLAIPYLMGQILGAMLAGFCVFSIFEPSIDAFEVANGITRGAPESFQSAVMFGEFYPNPGFSAQLDLESISIWRAMALEGFGTFVLILAIFQLTERRDQQDNIVPIMIGLVVTLIITCIAPFTQAGLNPARDLGPRLIASWMGWGKAAFPQDPGGWWWVYVAGPLLGGVFAWLSVFGIRKIQPAPTEVA
ncbi:MIP/aquaporin family protein [Pontibacter sp. G13]|uniref:MIP/aquaporin family protein n=1 Tax=Pontibacter sp. G13 TaxID=3074898 RepID=UPI00288AEBE3|nr:MIP/aquaporin family protein [Pontibacter sp. G13]WNJ21346.1 MIP/aquaporin family protein [Pontibacter sp. G13]